ncbi:MAG: Bax inhibitor-1/YccA family protein, partial [Bacteroidota bacterium]
MRRTANPALNQSIFDRSLADADGEVMTLSGTVNKSFTLILLVLAGAGITWFMFFDGNPATNILMIGGAIGGLVMAIVTSFNKKKSRITAPIYAVLEGLFLGGLSAFAESYFPGIVIQAVALTIGVFLGLLLAYKSGWIKATENFKLGVFAATAGIAFIYLISFVMSFFGGGIGFIHSSGTFGILFSVFVVVIAALNLVLDFDFIEQGAEQGAPKYMEWYAAFGLLVTLVWLYI